MIAGIIPAPSAWDPAVDEEKARSRWQRVINLMVEDGWISQADAKRRRVPKDHRSRYLGWSDDGRPDRLSHGAGPD